MKVKQSYFNPKSNHEQLSVEIKQYESIKNGYYTCEISLEKEGSDAAQYTSIFSIIDKLEFLKLKSIWLSYIVSIGKNNDIYLWIDKDACTLKIALKQIVSCLPIDYLDYCRKQIEFEKNFHVDEFLLDFIISDPRALLFVANAMRYYLPSFRQYTGIKNLRDDIVEHLRFSAFFRIDGFILPIYKNSPFTTARSAPTNTENQAGSHPLETSLANLHKQKTLALYDSHSLYPIKEIYNKNLTEEKLTSWIDKNNQEQLDYILKYLKQNNCLCMKDKFIPLSNEEKYLLILASLDCLLNIENPDIMKKPPRNPKGKNSSKPVQFTKAVQNKSEVFSERSFMIFRLKNNWDAKKRRKIKSQKSEDYLVKILKKDKPKMDALVKNRQLSETKLISQMLEEFYIVHGQDKKNSQKL